MLLLIATCTLKILLMAGLIVCTFMPPSLHFSTIWENSNFCVKCSGSLLVIQDHIYRGYRSTGINNIYNMLQRFTLVCPPPPHLSLY